MTKDDRLCDQHSGVVAKVANLKWLFIVLLGVILGGVGFLWSQQVEVKKELLTYQESLTGVMPGREGILIQMRDMSIENNKMIKRHLAKSEEMELKELWRKK